MYVKLLLIVLFCAIRPRVYSADSRLMLFQFDHTTCMSRDSLMGSCYPVANCLRQGGRPSGSCMFGLSSCCVVQKTCNSTSAANVVHFVNPSYPKQDTEPSTCTFTLQAYKKTTCQLRLDFMDFNIAPPKSKTENDESAPSCNEDEFSIKPNIAGILGFSKLCGNNTGQHMYIPVDTTLGPASVQLTMVTTGKRNYKWNIRVSQVDCSTNYDQVAPSGCLQYHTDERGLVQSLGNMGGYQGDLNYAICIRRSTGSCGIRYESRNEFSLEAADISVSNGDEGCDPPNDSNSTQSSKDATWVSHDYLFIPDGEVSGTEGHMSKICGDFMATNPVKSLAPGPFMLFFHSDDKKKTKEDREKGFTISYEQLSAC